MSKADLKAAMDLLDVKNPLRLSSKVPAFKTPPGNLPRGNEPEGKLPHRDLTEGNLPPVQQPQGELPAIELGDLPDCESPLGQLPPGDLPGANFRSERGRRRKEQEIREAIERELSLSPGAQERLLKRHLAEGWGKLPHAITRKLKCPSRHGLKLVDIALIATVFDRTIAQVHPVMFAPISTEDFRRETGMDDSNIRLALKGLVARGVLLKLITSFINFWALNPDYFSQNQGETPPGKLPPGKQPQGNAPGSKQGDLPGVMGGQITPGQTGLANRNDSENLTSKNLIQESKKESSLSASQKFPKEMLHRWETMRKSGLELKARNEREIFQEMFLAHGKAFFDHCGRVVAFLEEQGTGKKGEDTTVHSPMVWIRGHWDGNFTRYQNWIAKEQAIGRAHTDRLEREAQAQAAEYERKRIQLEQDRETDEWKSELDRDFNKFLSVYTDEIQSKLFAEEAIRLTGQEFVWNSWRSFGWKSPHVLRCVVEHLRKVQSGERISQVVLTNTVELK